MGAGMNFEPDQIFEVPYPFIREKVELLDEDGPLTVNSWRPGTRAQLVYPDDSEDVADGMGTQVLTVISTHRPGRFPTRVFYTQEWITPDGKRFGKKKCRITVNWAFRTKTEGFRHDFEMSTPSKQPEAA